MLNFSRSIFSLVYSEKFEFIVITHCHKDKDCFENSNCNTSSVISHYLSCIHPACLYSHFRSQSPSICVVTRDVKIQKHCPRHVGAGWAEDSLPGSWPGSALAHCWSPPATTGIQKLSGSGHRHLLDIIFTEIVSI